ncbi:MAG: TatD family hydrolase [Desulfurococcales archaeon]|nr:TatD family hydrolase [Desulfurococcales archaeon]
MKCSYADPHLHPNPIKGLGGEKIAFKSKKAGIWFLGFLSLPPWDYGLEPSLHNYEKVMEMITKECRKALNIGIQVKCFSGFHPAEIDRLIDHYRLKPLEVLEMGVKILSIIKNKCVNGELDGIGEVGHQHYKTFPDRALISHQILEKALEISGDYECPIQMHLENNEHSTVAIIHETIMKTVGKPSRRIIFHHSKPSMAIQAYEKGYMSTVPGVKKPLLEYLFSRIPPVYMLESDFVDDNRGFSTVYPWIAVEMQESLLHEGKVDEEYLCKINLDIPREVFSI